MRILLTGSSSFTGLHFARALAAAGHEVTATFRGHLDAYEPLRKQRAQAVAACCRAEFGCAFGDDRFLAIARAHRFDALCHHAAEMRDYKSPDYDYLGSTAAATHRIDDVLATLAAGGCRRVLYTGTVFEPDEGAGEHPRRAFSPYGLAKHLTWEVLRHFAAAHHLHTAKLVVPNPFGPLENPRFTTYLATTWLRNETADVRTPAYVRDNIHVTLLARAYADFVGTLPDTPGESRLAPSGWTESMGAFAQRFAEAMRPRLHVPCALRLATQTDWSEPRVRINTDVLDPQRLGWDESRAWDELAEDYLAITRGPHTP